MSVLGVLFFTCAVLTGVLWRTEDPRVLQLAALVEELRATSGRADWRRGAEAELLEGHAALTQMAAENSDQSRLFAKAYFEATDQMVLNLGYGLARRTELWTDAMKLFVRIGLPKFAMYARLWYADLLVESGDAGRAKAIELWALVANAEEYPESRVDAYLALVHAHLVASELDLADDWVHRARAWIGDGGSDSWSKSQRTSLLGQEVDLRNEQGRPDFANELARQLDAMVRDDTDPITKFDLQIGLLRTLVAEGKVDRALRIADQLLESLPELRTSLGPARADEEEVLVRLERAMAYGTRARAGGLRMFALALFDLEDCLKLGRLRSCLGPKLELQVLTRIAEYSALAAASSEANELDTRELAALRLAVLSRSLSSIEHFDSMQVDLQTWSDGDQTVPQSLMDSLRGLSSLALAEAQAIARDLLRVGGAKMQAASTRLAHFYGVRGRFEFDLLGRDAQAKLAAEMVLVSELLLGSWKGSLAYGSELVFLKYPSRRLLWGEMLRARSKLGVSADDLLRDLQAIHACGAIAHRAGYEERSLKAIQRALVPESGALLCYVLGVNRGLLFCIEAERVRVIELPEGHHRVSGVVRDFRRHTLEETSIENRVQRSLAVSELLLPASVVRDLDRWKHLSIVGLEDIGPVPFEWLILDGKPLFHRCAVSYLPTIPLGMLLAEREAIRPESNGTWIVFGDPVMSAAHGGRRAVALPPERVETWSGVLAASRVVARVGADATLEGLVARGSAAAQVLTVITHGGYNQAMKEPVLAVAGDDAWLRPSALHAMTGSCRSVPRIPDLVTLYACEGAAQHKRPGQDGAQGFAGTFLELGAHSVLLASERLNVGFVFALSDFFDRKLVEEGLSSAVALQQVLIEHGDELVAQQAALGLLRVVGLGHRRIFPK